jgi:Ca2+-binding RTX toxin-like protein
LGQIFGDSGDNTLVGGASGDEISGYAGADRLLGMGGDDTLWGGLGNDRLEGGSGNDRIYGRGDAGVLDGGNDTVYYGSATSGVTVSLELQNTFQNTVGAGQDFISQCENIFGSSHDDALTGDGNANSLSGGGGNDTLSGQGGADSLWGGGGSVNILYGGEGDDQLHSESQDQGGLHGGGGNDSLYGSVGFDILSGEAGDDYLHGFTGFDVASYTDAASGVAVSLYLSGGWQATGGSGSEFLVDIEGVYGSAFGDALTGNGSGNVLSGLDGDDTLNGGGSDAGDDTVLGGAGVDTITYQGATAGVSVDLAYGLRQNTGGGGWQRIGDVENLTGSALGDLLIGDAAANRLRGADGSDVLVGGLGGDTLDGGDGSDRIDFDAAGSRVKINLALTGAQDTKLGVKLIVNVENVLGTAFNDAITGDRRANALYGKDGGDVLDGKAGADTIEGGAGNDLIEGGSGIDRADFADAAGAVSVNLALTVRQDTGNGLDTLSGIENLFGSSFGDILRGDGKGNRLDGWSGADTLIGGGGADVLTGGAGVDRYVINSLGDILSSSADRITDLEDGEAIDLSGVDANANLAGNQAFIQMTRFTGHAGELIMRYVSAKDITRVLLDVDGDKVADGAIVLTGVQTGYTDFVL